MTELLNGLTEDARMLAPELRVTSDIPAGLRVSADHNLIQQILHNLVSNAIKFNTPDGWIHITASRSANEVFVSVSNASHGIDPADARRVFERFYRGDPAHGRAVDGVGLGLSLSREIARAHGGDLTLETGQDARVFLQLVLPDLPNRLH
jgi:signal transduction histidine kinase